MLSDEEKIAARLFIADALNLGAEVRFDASRTHYLRNVLRLAPGNWLALVNGRDGEARARIEGLEKRGGYARIIAITRAFTPEPDLWLLFAPIKRARLDLLVEKATELGVARLLPTLTRRTNTDRLSRERLILIAREATEQCERLTLPIIEESVSLTQRLADWPADRFLIVADETGGNGDALSALAILPPGAKLALLIGPEGGFDPIERELLKGLAIEGFPRHGASKVNAVSLVLAGGRFVLRVGLGPRILRSDTAAAALLTLVQAQNGDWRKRGPRDCRLSL